MSNYFSGRIHSVIFENIEAGFYILKMVLDKDDSSNLERLVIVRGNILGLPIKINLWFGFEACWDKHDTYGMQLKILKAPVFKEGWSSETVCKMLEGYGVSYGLLDRFKKAFQTENEFFEALSSEKIILENGFDLVEAEFLKRKWDSIRAYFKSVNFLNDVGLSNKLIQRVWSSFGDDAESILSTNPWKLVELDGFKFQDADEVALKLGLDRTHPNRLIGAVYYFCKMALNSGHVFTTSAQLYEDCHALITYLTPTLLAQTLAKMKQEGVIQIDKTTRPGTIAIYNNEAYKIEQWVSETLVSRLETAKIIDTPEYVSKLSKIGPKTEKVVGKELKKKKTNLDKIVQVAMDEWGSFGHVPLSDLQKKGVVNALISPVSILTGLPGSGKTTALKAVVQLLRESEIPFLLCAPTGIAAKNMEAKTGAKAFTIHKAFGAKGSSVEERDICYAGILGDSNSSDKTIDSSDSWEYGKNCKHKAQVVILDETSMCSLDLLYRILSCTEDSCRLVFVGDAAQLPSVGPGNVLRDLILTTKFPTVSLTEIFRQKETSAVVYAAHDIYKGVVPSHSSSSDFSLIFEPNEMRARNLILELSEKFYESRTMFQVLSPRHAGELGVTNLNRYLRELLNPKKPGLQEFKIGEEVLREDDRIMVVKNKYKYGIYNGDMGKISKVDLKSKAVEIKVFGETQKIIIVPFSELRQLIRLSYCTTVNKFQGMETEVIVMPLVDGFKHQLQRNLLYTGITRAKKRVVLVGTETALEKAVMNDKEDARNSMLCDRIIKFLV